MTDVATIIAWTLLALAVIQVFAVLGFAWVLWRRRPLTIGKRPEDEWPEAAIVLCLRGGDPFLRDCLQAVLTQDYPRYRVKVIVDSVDDPAWNVVQQVVAELDAKHVEVEPLEQPLETCSLKCSSLVQAVRHLDPSCEVVALVDADTIAHPTWLKELVEPLADPRVAATTGNRWYMPQRPSWGAMVRYIWNAAAIVQMYGFEIAWGGTLAIKTSVLRETDLLERWSRAFCEDTMLKRQLGRQGLKVRFVPSLMMVNREDCSLGGYYRWVKRQLLTARLYHPAFPVTMLHGVTTTLAPAAALAATIWAAAVGDGKAALIAGVSLLLYEVAMVLVLLPLEAAVRSVVRTRHETTRWMTAKTWLMYFASLPLTQIVYPVALLNSTLLRRVEWRGVDYEIGGPQQIRRLQYQPFVAEEEATESL